MTRGYTLIEVVVVLLVLALVAGLVAPSVGRSVDGFRMRAEVAGVASFLRAARAQAITHETPCKVHLDQEAHALVRQGDEIGRATKRVSAALRLVTTTPAGTIIFYPHGRSSGGHLLIEVPGSTVYVVTIDAMTGRVTTRRRES